MDRQYNEKYDAYYDADSDEWLEGACSDPDCEFCPGRPERPSQAEQQS